MAILRTVVVCALMAAAGLSITAFATRSSYLLHGPSTMFWDHDVDYYSPPITLQRQQNTWDFHDLEFNALRYQAFCSQWEKVCVAYNPQGQCISWENRCIYWAYQTFPVQKRVRLDFRTLPKLAEKEIEVYQIQINRQKPMGDGEDWVTTWFSALQTKVPVVVRKFGDENYSIEPKPPKP